MIALMHPAVEFHTSGVFPGLKPVYTGHAGFRAFYREFSEMWSSFLISLDEVRDCGERALVRGMFEGRGRDDLLVRRPTPALWTFRDGLIIGIKNYADWSQAVEAAEQSE